MIIHIFAVFYSMSRGTWVSLFLSFVVILGVLSINRSAKGRRLVLKSCVGMGIIVVMYLIFSFSGILPDTGNTFQHRFQTLIQMADYGQERSISTRRELINEGLDLFSSKPVLGIGTSNFLVLNDLLPHNDYIQIMSEHGFLGITLFLFALFAVVVEIFQNRSNSWEAISLKHSALTIMLYMNFIDAYKLTMIYVIFAFLFISRTRKVVTEIRIGESNAYSMVK